MKAPEHEKQPHASRFSGFINTMRWWSIIDMNARAHDNIFAGYESLHGEIFNPVEQERLKRKLSEALTFLQAPSERKLALDYGCGTGNLTSHLIEAGVKVVSADVSKKFLESVGNKYSRTGLSETLMVDGRNLSGIQDDTFDIVATYSVLHHIPDYLSLVMELHRVTNRGGVIYIDHELNDSYWQPDDKYAEFLKCLPPKPKAGWRKYLKLSSYVNGVRLLLNPRWKPEGDIHVWPDDHIEWDKIEAVLRSLGAEIVLKEDYLLFRRDYPENIYVRYKESCSDTRLLVARKKQVVE